MEVVERCVELFHAFVFMDVQFRFTFVRKNK